MAQRQKEKSKKQSSMGDKNEEQQKGNLMAEEINASIQEQIALEDMMHISEDISIKDDQKTKPVKNRHHLNHSLSIFDKFDYEKKVEEGIHRNYLQPYKIKDKNVGGQYGTPYKMLMLSKKPSLVSVVSKD